MTSRTWRMRLALQAAALCYLPSVTKLEQADQNLTAAEGACGATIPNEPGSSQITAYSWMPLRVSSTMAAPRPSPMRCELLT